MAIFTGTSGDDFFTGTGFGDDFHLEQGGDDTAKGGAGVDVFYMDAAFTSDDRLNGGGGHDYLILDGDYSAGVNFTAKSLVKVETIQLLAGHGYDLSGLGELSGLLTVDGSALAALDALVADGSTGAQDLAISGGAGDDSLAGGGGSDTLNGGEGDNSLIGGAGGDNLTAGGGADNLNGGDGNDVLVGGGGSDTLIGGARNDHIFVGSGAAIVDAGVGDDLITFLDIFDSGSHIDAGAGSDRVTIGHGADGPLTLSAANFAGVELLTLDGHFAYALTLEDDLVSAEQTFTVSGATSGGVNIDGSRETDGHLILAGSGLDDVLIGGALADTLSAGNGNDSLDGGAGDDVLSAIRGHFTLVGGDGDDSFRGGGGAGGSSSETLIGGLGVDTFHLRSAIDHLVYADVAESTAAAPDLIVHLENVDQIDLSAIDADATQGGDQAFHLVSALSGQAGELALIYDSFRDLTTLQGDVDGDGQADRVILLRGDESGFTNFVL